MAVDDVDLLAYADGQLAPERRAEVEAAVAASAEMAGRLRAIQASALPYAAAFEAQPAPPVPRELSSAVAALVRTDWRHGSRSRWALPRLASAFAAGILCCAVAVRLLSLTGPASPTALQVEPWIQAAADYQRMYSRATVVHVNEDPHLTAQVVADLWAADGMKVGIPDLRAAGLTFKRVQRLNFRDRPVVQMVYLPEQGEPLALCITRDARPDERPQPPGDRAISATCFSAKPRHRG